MHLQMILVNTGDINLTPATGDVLNAETASAALTLSTRWSKYDIICWQDDYWSVTTSVFAS